MGGYKIEIITHNAKKDGAENYYDIVVDTLRSEGNDTPLFLIAPGNRGVAAFRRAIVHFAPGRPIYSLIPPRVSGKGHISSINNLANCFADAVDSRACMGKAHIAGYSIGGITAYETARVLAERGSSVSTLTIIDTLGPRWSLFGLLTMGFIYLFPDLFALITKITGDQRLVELAHDDRLISQLKLASKYTAGAWNGKLHMIRCPSPTWTDPVLVGEWHKLARQVITKVTPGNHSTIFLEPKIKELVATLDGILVENSK